MKSGFLILALLLMPLYSFAELADGTGTTYRPTTPSTSDEKSETVSQAKTCQKFAEERPDLKDMLNLTGKEMKSEASILDMAKNCGIGILSAWKDTITELIVNPIKFLLDNTETMKFFEECNKSYACKLRLHYEAYDRPPSANDLKKYQGQMSIADLDILQRNARSRMNSSFMQNQRLREEIKLRKWAGSSSQTKDDELVYQQEKQSFWVLVKEMWTKEKTKWQCLKPEAAQEMFCYYLANIIDPTIAAGVIAKAPRIASLLKKTGGAAVDASRARALGKADNLAPKMPGEDVSYLSGLKRETDFGTIKIVNDKDVGALSYANKDAEVMAIVNGDEFYGTPSELIAHMKSQKSVKDFTLGSISGADNAALATRPGVSKIISDIDGTGKRGMAAISSLGDNHVTEVAVLMKSGRSVSFKGNKEMIVAMAGRSDVAAIVTNKPASWLPPITTVSPADLKAAPTYDKMLNPSLVSNSNDLKIRGMTVSHGTIDGLVGSVKAGPRNVGSGFGGRGLYLDTEVDARIADTYASHAAQNAKARSASAGVELTTSKPVVMTGTINPNKNLKVVSIRVSRDISKPDFERGVFPFNWDEDPALALYMERNYDIVEVLDAKKNGLNLDTNRILIVHERAGKDAIIWNNVAPAK